MPKVKLETIIESMLKENTGASFLDSGGAYGRNYERNQKRDFAKEPACEVECHEYNGEVELLIYYNLYHYLTNFLDYDEDCEKLNKEYNDFCNLFDNKEESWYHCLDKWLDKFDDVRSWNTYNYENILSQVIQGSDFAFEKNQYIALQIHGGCDVRGGYTKPVIFKVPEMDYFLMAQNDVSAYARYPIDENQTLLEGVDKPKQTYIWDSDDGGYHWYAQDNEPKLKDILRCVDDKPFVEIGGKLLPLIINVTEDW